MTKKDVVIKKNELTAVALPDDYLMFPISQTSDKLSWSHICELSEKW